MFCKTNRFASVKFIENNEITAIHCKNRTFFSLVLSFFFRFILFSWNLLNISLSPKYEFVFDVHAQNIIMIVIQISISRKTMWTIWPLSLSPLFAPPPLSLCEFLSLKKAHSNYGLFWFYFLFIIIKRVYFCEAYRWQCFITGSLGWRNDRNTDSTNNWNN